MKLKIEYLGNCEYRAECEDIVVDGKNACDCLLKMFTEAERRNNEQARVFILDTLIDFMYPPKKEDLKERL